MNRLRNQLLQHSFLKYYLKIFRLRKVPEPQTSVSILVEHALTTLFKKQQKIKISRALRLAVILCKMRQHHYPIQYLLGEWPFRYLNLKVKAPILVPRFQTQNMVGLLLEQIRKRWAKGTTLVFVDYGCGTGAIGLSLFKQLQEQYDLKGIFVDISQRCINITKQNAVNNNLSLHKMQFICDDMLKMLHKVDQCHIIASNPPYLQDKHYYRLQKQVKRYEAKTALVSGPTGLQLVKPLAEAIMNAQLTRKDIFGAIEYGGEDVSEFGGEKHVVLDQYCRRRYLIFS